MGGQKEMVSVKGPPLCITALRFPHRLPLYGLASSLPQLLRGCSIAIAPWVEPVEDLLEEMLSFGGRCAPRAWQDRLLQVPVLHLR